MHTPLAFKIAAIYLSHSWRWFTNKCIVKKPIFSLQPWRGRAKQTASCLCCLSQNVMEIEDETFTHCFKITLTCLIYAKLREKRFSHFFRKIQPLKKKIFSSSNNCDILERSSNIVLCMMIKKMTKVHKCNLQLSNWSKNTCIILSSGAFSILKSSARRRIRKTRFWALQNLWSHDRCAEMCSEISTNVMSTCFWCSCITQFSYNAS